MSSSQINKCDCNFGIQRVGGVELIHGSLKADFLSSQKPLAASQQVFASSQNHFLSLHKYDNLMNIGLASLSNRGS